MDRSLLDCVTINVVSENRRILVFYTRGLFQTADCEMAESKMGEEKACLNNKQKKKIQVKECDIGNRDGTVDDRKQDINDPKVLGTSWGTRTEDRKRAAKKMTMDNHQQDINDLRVLGTKLGGNKKVNKGNQGEDGRVKMYKDEGAGLSRMVKGGGAGLGNR